MQLLEETLATCSETKSLALTLILTGCVCACSHTDVSLRALAYPTDGMDSADPVAEVRVRPRWLCVCVCACFYTDVSSHAPVPSTDGIVNVSVITAVLQ